MTWQRLMLVNTTYDEKDWRMKIRCFCSCSSCFKLTTIPWPSSPCGKSAVHQHGGRSPTQQRYPPTNSGSCCIAQHRDISGVENPMKWQKMKSQVKKHNKISTGYIYILYVYIYIRVITCIYYIWYVMLYPSGNGMIENVSNIFWEGIGAATNTIQVRRDPDLRNDHV